MIRLPMLLLRSKRSLASNSEPIRCGSNLFAANKRSLPPGNHHRSGIKKGDWTRCRTEVKKGKTSIEIPAGKLSDKQVQNIIDLLKDEEDQR
jgi:hypothetical protein